METKEKKGQPKITKIITDALEKVVGKTDITLESPEIEDHGDYSSNIALVTAKKEGKNPRTLATEIGEKLKSDKGLMDLVEKIEVAGPGFINFHLAKDYLLKNLSQVGGSYGKVDTLKGKKFLIEHTSPNTIKTLHVGHVRNNVLGMAVHNILKMAGAEVKLDSINNDRGIHVMKAVWAYMKYGDGKTPKTEKVKPDHFCDKYYLMGSKESKNPKVKEEMQELLRKWEAGDGDVRAVWKKLRDWTFEGFLETYKRLGSYHDKEWFESDFYEHGKELVELGLKKGVFKKLPDGAVLTNLKKYNLSDTIVLRSDGTSMYITQDLFLTTLKRKEFPSDLYIWDVGPEQSLYLKQLFAVCEQLGNGKIEDYFHLSYGAINVKGLGKMSSRAGNVTSADELMDIVVKKAAKENDAVAEDVGLGAIKYGFLKLNRESDVTFDIDQSLSLEGNSGPYIQYTYARALSVLSKAKLGNKVKVDKNLNKEEQAILKHLVKYPEVVELAAAKYAPNLVCNYIYELAQKFNTFYNLHKIVGSDSEDMRLLITKATATVLKSGLNLLGIAAPEKM